MFQSTSVNYFATYWTARWTERLPGHGREGMRDITAISSARTLITESGSVLSSYSMWNREHAGYSQAHVGVSGFITFRYGCHQSLHRKYTRHTSGCEPGVEVACTGFLLVMVDGSLKYSAVDISSVGRFDRVPSLVEKFPALCPPICFSGFAGYCLLDSLQLLDDYWKCCFLFRIDIVYV